MIAPAWVFYILIIAVTGLTINTILKPFLKEDTSRYIFHNYIYPAFILGVLVIMFG